MKIHKWKLKKTQVFKQREKASRKTSSKHPQCSKLNSLRELPLIHLTTKIIEIPQTFNIKKVAISSNVNILLGSKDDWDEVVKCLKAQRFTENVEVENKKRAAAFLRPRKPKDFGGFLLPRTTGEAADRRRHQRQKIESKIFRRILLATSAQRTEQSQRDCSTLIPFFFHDKNFVHLHDVSIEGK